MQHLEKERCEGREQNSNSRKCCPQTHTWVSTAKDAGVLQAVTAAQDCSVWSLRYPALARQEDQRCSPLQSKPALSMPWFYPLSISVLHLVDSLPFSVNSLMSSIISLSKRFVFHVVLWNIQKQVPKTFCTTLLSDVDCSHRGQR